MRKVVVAVPVFTVIWIVVTSFVLLSGFNYNLPDFVHVDYGVPLTWATNTLSTIAGSANLWTVSIYNLLVDLVFWLGIMAIIDAVMVWRLKT